MTTTLDSHRISLTGPGFAVIDDYANLREGHWATREEAREHGLLGMYALTGLAVVEVPDVPEPLAGPAARVLGVLYERSLSPSLDPEIVHGIEETALLTDDLRALGALTADAASKARVQACLDVRATMRGLDPEAIYFCGGIPLLVKDLKALLAA